MKIITDLENLVNRQERRKNVEESITKAEQKRQSQKPQQTSVER